MGEALNIFIAFLSPSTNLQFSDVPTGIDGIRAIYTNVHLTMMKNTGCVFHDVG
jgi:hypothetical protein